MERFLDEMMKRSAVFDVVFWEGQCLVFFLHSPIICASADMDWLLNFLDLRHGTLKTGSPDFVSTSRALARQLLFAHLVQHADTMRLNVFTFEGLEDPEWDKYRRKTRVRT